MSRIVWDDPKDRLYETGIRNVVLYVQNENAEYPAGVAWNGVSSLSESPSGADETKIWADDMKYLSIRAAEELGATLECYTYPDEFMECDGSRAMLPGVYVGQQVRKPFGLCYRTTLGNDIKDNDYSYKLHLLYNATASPSERGYQTINDSPETITFSYELSTTPINMPNGLKASALITIDASKFTTEQQLANLAALEAVLYGSDGTTSYVATEDLTPQAGKTYYTRSGSAEPYTYTEFTGSEFAQGTTYYEKVTTGATTARLPLPAEVHQILSATG